MAFMDIFNGFRTAQTTQSATPSQQATQVATDKLGGAVGNTTVPGGGAPQNDGTIAAFPATKDNTGNKNPLENYSDLWKIDTTKTVSGTAEPTMIPQLTVDPQKILEASRTIDFTKGIDATLLEKASKGDMDALAGLINGVAQNSYAQGALATTNIVQRAFTLQDQNFRSTVMPSILRRHSISNEVQKNPIFENPATAPMLSMLEQQFTQKYPTASPAEIRQHAENYLNGFAAEIVKGQGGTITPRNNPADGNSYGIPSRQETDWEKFFLGNNADAA